MLIRLVSCLQAVALRRSDFPADPAVVRRPRWSFRSERGQATAEYALVILGAVALATLLLNWARGSHAISRLFDTIVDKIIPS